MKMYLWESIVFTCTVLYASERSLQKANILELAVTGGFIYYYIFTYILTHRTLVSFVFVSYICCYLPTIIVIRRMIPMQTRTRWALVVNRSFHVICAYTRLLRTILLRQKLVITTTLYTFVSKFIIHVQTMLRWAENETCISNGRSWSKEMPEGLLHLIQRRLPVSDQLQMRAVCRSWQSTTRVVSSLPWLMNGSHPLSNTDPFFYSLGENKVYKSCPPLMSRRGCVGSIDGWLIMVDNVLWRPEGFMSPRSFYLLLHDDQKPLCGSSIANYHTSNFFFNPISGARVDLPSQSTIPCRNSNQPSFFCKVIASSAPTSPPCNCLVAAICSDGGLAFCRPTDYLWTFIAQARHLVFDDIEIVDGKLYAAPKWSNEDASQFLMVFDIQNIVANGGGCPFAFAIETFKICLPLMSPPLREARRDENCVKITCHNSHLANDSTTKNLFVILRENSFAVNENPLFPWSVVIGDTDFKVPPKTRGFRVFKLELNADGNPGWLEIFYLSDRILFLSGAANKIMDVTASNSLYYDHLQDKILETNCIYFVFDHSCLSLCSAVEALIFRSSCVERHDVGVFSLKDCKIRPLSNFPNHPTQLRARPLWFTPDTA